MFQVPAPVAEFLRGKRLVVAGVSRDSAQPANAIFRRLRDSGYEVFPVNPNATTLEGATCYPDLASVPGTIDGVVAAVHPKVGVELVRQCADNGVKQIWFHRSFGEGSVSEEALAECKSRGIQYIEGGCPMMYCAPVDLAHRCMRWWLGHQGKVPV